MRVVCGVRASTLSRLARSQASDQCCSVFVADAGVLGPTSSNEKHDDNDDGESDSHEDHDETERGDDDASCSGDIRRAHFTAFLASARTSAIVWAQSARFRMDTVLLC